MNQEGIKVSARSFKPTIRLHDGNIQVFWKASQELEINKFIHLSNKHFILLSYLRVWTISFIYWSILFDYSDDCVMTIIECFNKPASWFFCYIVFSHFARDSWHLSVSEQLSLVCHFTIERQSRQIMQIISTCHFYGRSNWQNH